MALDHKAVIILRCRGCGKLGPVIAARVVVLRYQARGELVLRYCMCCRTQTEHEPTTMTIEEMEA